MSSEDISNVDKKRPRLCDDQVLGCPLNALSFAVTTNVSKERQYDTRQCGYNGDEVGIGNKTENDSNAQR